MAIKIEKRSGELVPFDVDKIKKVTNWATEGLDVSPLKLESAVTTLFSNGTKTVDIQENLILTAHRFVTLQESDWRYVAGRLKVMDYWKVVQKSRGYGYEGDFAEYIKWQVEKGRYDFPLDKYTEVELRNAAIFLNPDYDKDYDYAGANLLIKRYLVEDELPQEAFLVIALILAQDVQEDRFKFIRDVYLAIAQRRIGLATPFLRNCRRLGGNLGSCFLLTAEDSLLDGDDCITDNWKSIASISKQGGGVGYGLSRIRARGSWVNKTKGASHGLVPWIKIINDIAVGVNFAPLFSNK
jgi:ribonucleoside-diphosphate reductase alpha chain